MADGGADPFPKLGSVYRATGSNSRPNQLRKNGVQTSGESRVSSSQVQNMLKPNVIQNSWSNAWGKPNLIQKLTKETDGGSCSSGVVPEPGCEDYNEEEIVTSDSDSDILYDSDEEVSLDDTDSDTGEKNHEGAKKSKWFRDFFSKLNKLSDEDIYSTSIRRHCPACRGAPGAIDWYHGLQPLLVHAKTIKVRRVRLHRLFAETLEEECLRRRAPLTTEGYGAWEGLQNKVKDHEIVWPPMVMIMNTRYQRGEDNKWTGMGNQELLDYFSEYAALKARHSYGPQGHRGISVLIFDESAAGYLESVRLHKAFREQGRDKEAWNRCKSPFVPGGRRQLYGYLASREDLENFNQHSGSRLKFQMKSYQEMVESQIKYINDDVQQLDYFKNKAAKEELKSEVFANTLGKVSEKLRQSKAENHVVRERIKEQQQQSKEEMDEQENFFLDQIQIIRQTVSAKEDTIEKLQDAKLEEEVKLACGDAPEKEDENQIMEKISSLIEFQGKEIRQFEEERFNIMKNHLDKKLALKKKQMQEQVELEKELENEILQLVDKYSSVQIQEENQQKCVC